MSDDLHITFGHFNRYVEWGPDDEARLRRVAACVRENCGEIVDDFYDEILRHRETAAVLSGSNKQISRLKESLTSWLMDLMEGPYDANYVDARIAVGRRHVAIGLDQGYANAALARMRLRLVRIIKRAHADSVNDLAAIEESLHKRIDLDSILMQEAYEAEFVEQQRKLAKRNFKLQTVLHRSLPDWRLVGESPKMHAVYRLIERAGPSDKPILIEGESGTGKELVARALHQASNLADEPLITVNCAALPETLLESELFGHEKGAFTGALAAKPGLFEIADGGTIFIDEIGELAGSLQAKLLRVLEDGHLRRIGSVKEINVKVRVLAATNRNLAEEVEAGRFREDLYYRINVLRINLPPLRERPGDIRLLVEHFATGEWTFSDEFLRVLERYSWPGNVRQLRNALERAKILADDDSLRPDALPPEITSFEHLGVHQENGLSGEKLESVTRQHIEEVLDRCEGNKARTARALGVSRRTLYRLLEKYGIDNS